MHETIGLGQAITAVKHVFLMEIIHKSRGCLKNPDILSPAWGRWDTKSGDSSENPET